jgi:chromosomal replication initiation ATPase DnaA
MRQLALPLPAAGEGFGPFIPDSSNEQARRWLAQPGRWPLGRLAIHGPEGVGKTHLLASTGWRQLPGPGLRGLPDPRGAAGIALDDADCVPDPAALFHLINASAEAGIPLLLAGRTPPGRWPTGLPDLESRLRATHGVGIAEPSDDLLRALLARHFAARQVIVPASLQDWLLARLPREAGAVAAAAARLDRAALAGRARISQALARAVLADLPGFAREGDDNSMAPAAAASSLLPGLL